MVIKKLLFFCTIIFFNFSLIGQEVVQLDTLAVVNDNMSCCSNSNIGCTSGEACCNKICCDPDYSGVVLSFYGADIAYRDFSVASVIDGGTTKYRVVPEQNSTVEVGAALLMQYGYKIFPNKLCNSLGAHLSIGPGISFSPNPRPRLVTGLGLSFGASGKLSLDIGAVSGYIDVLSNSVDLNERYDEIPQKLMSSKLATRLFGSLGYRICF